MKDKKMVTCILTGQEIPKRKSKLVLDYRVCSEGEDVAKGLLIDATSIFLKFWMSHNKSAINRTHSLIYAVTVIKACVEIVGCDATIFIVELKKQAEAIGDPIHDSFSDKMFHFLGDKYIYELDDDEVRYKIKVGLEGFREQWDNDK